MQFLDEAKIFIKSGAGGTGCTSFLRQAHMPNGGPDGGDGGRGGSIIAQTTGSLNTLIDFRYKQHIKAKRGMHGMGKQRTGKSADDVIITLPVGTQILSEDKSEIIADLDKPNMRVVLAQGGEGGRGNMQFKSSTNRAPRQHTDGTAGEEQWIWLRLKLLSDAGLVGLPNAGKSTFLSVVTRAKPKIADYPFTTLAPQLGVVYADEQEFVLADIPGIIKGAHEGVGLGTRFLGHVERCGVLLHLVDATADDITIPYDMIREELAAYGNGLSEKPELLALSKADIISEEDYAEKCAALEAHSGQKVYALSSATHQGTEDICREMLSIIKEYRATQARDADDAEAHTLAQKPASDNAHETVTESSDAFFIDSPS